MIARRFAALLTLMVVAWSAGAAAQQSPPWIFVYFDPQADRLDHYNGLNFYAELQKDPETAPEVYGLIAKGQDRPGNGSCFGLPYAAETVDMAASLLRSSLDWYYANGFTEADFTRRAEGWRVEPAWIGAPTKTGGRAIYFTCSDKPSGYMQTSNFGPRAANIIHMGGGVGEFTDHPATFRLSAAHELTHVVQNNLAPFAASDNYDQLGREGGWVIEATADAIAVRHTFEHHGKEYFGPYSDKYYRRFFLVRPYNIPLNLPPGSRGSFLRNIDSRTLNNLDYQTNGFWYHVIERYLDGEPARLNGFYRRLSHPAVSNNLTGVVDGYLQNLVGSSKKGLAHVYPQFLTEYATWWDHRFDGAMGRERWRELAFEGCAEASFETSTAQLMLELAEYAGDCFTVTVPAELVAKTPDMEIRLKGVGNVTDELYLGQADATGFDARLAGNRNADCTEIVERQLSPKAMPCLLDPRQGRRGGELERYFHIPEISGVGDLEMMFVVTRVPDDVRDVGEDFDIEPIDVELSLDYGAVAGGGSGSAGGEGERTAVTDYASKAGRARVSPDSETVPGESGPREILSGDFDIIAGVDPAIEAAVMQQMDASVSVRVEPDDGQASNEALSVGFRFAQRLEPGDAGPVEVMATTGGDSRMGLQNPDVESRFVIEEYSGQTLRFRGVANVCEGEMIGLAALRQRADLCEMFPPARYEVSGAVSFPTARNSQDRLQPAETPAYLAYKDLRLDALLGSGDSPGLLERTDVRFQDVDGGAGGGSGQGQVPDQSGPCACTCSSRAQEEAAPQCKLLCAPRWAACSAP